MDRITEALQSKAGVEKSNVKILKDAEADYNGVSSGMRWLASSTQPEDTVVIYFSGHGGNHNGEGVLVLYPGEPKKKTKKDNLRPRIRLTKNEFGAFLKKIPARKKILIVDSCHSRAIRKGLKIDDGDLISDYLQLGDSEEDERPMTAKSSPPNYGNDHEALLASARKDQTSRSSKDLRGGVFTYFLVKAMKQGSPNLNEAFSQAKENIADWYRKREKKDPPIACIEDPHGMAPAFRFQN